MVQLRKKKKKEGEQILLREFIGWLRGRWKRFLKLKASICTEQLLLSVSLGRKFEETF